MQVFEAAQKGTDATFAVKTAITLGGYEDLAKEAMIHAKLDHDCIVPLRAVVTNRDGRVEALVLDFCDGGTLSGRVRHIREVASTSIYGMLNIARQALEGLEYIHSKGFVHMDFKPGNVLLRTPATSEDLLDIDLVIADLGIAWPVDSLCPCQGTPYFKAPELLGYLDAEPDELVHVPARPEMDIFSFGLTMLLLVHSVDSNWDLRHLADHDHDLRQGCLYENVEEWGYRFFESEE